MDILHDLITPDLKLMPTVPCYFTRWFSYRLSLSTTTGQPKRPDVRVLVAETEFEIEDHSTTTKDGFVLVLHRLVSKKVTTCSTPVVLLIVWIVVLVLLLVVVLVVSTSIMS